MSAGLDRGLLGLYLADHLSGATGGLARVERMAEDYTDKPWHGDLVSLVRELRSERDEVRSIIESLGTSRRPLRQGLAWAGERLGRLKLNRRLTSRSPMSPVLELELMRGAVMAKQGLWQVLRDLPAEHHAALGVEAAELDRLVAQAADQRDRLERMHAQVRGTAFLEGAAG